MQLNMVCYKVEVLEIPSSTPPTKKTEFPPSIFIFCYPSLCETGYIAIKTITDQLYIFILVTRLVTCKAESSQSCALCLDVFFFV